MSCSHSFRFVSGSRRSVVCRKVCSPFLFCLLLLFLVFAATPFTSSPGRLSSFSSPISWMTAVSAAPLRPNVFPGPVQLATACDICQDMIMHLVLQIARALDFANRTVATREDSEVFMEHLCEPDNVGGSWIRRLGLLVVPDDANDLNSSLHFELQVLKDYTKCKRGCVTISELCESLKEAPFFDVLPDRIVALSQKADLVMDGNAVRKLGVTVCGHFEVCEERKKYMASLNALLNEPGSSLRSEIESDTIEWVSREEFETELKMYESQEKYNANSFSSKQLEELHAAFARGDRQAASAIDKSVSTLTEEEFDVLHKLALEQEMGMKNEFSNGEEMESEKELEFTHVDKEEEGNIDSVRESEEEKTKMCSGDDL